MILLEWLVGTKRNAHGFSARISGEKPLFAVWCGRRDSNPHSLWEKDFKSAQFPLFSIAIPFPRISVPVSARSGWVACRNDRTLLAVEEGRI
jgi:hypothetical protein